MHPAFQVDRARPSGTLSGKIDEGRQLALLASECRPWVNLAAQERLWLADNNTRLKRMQKFKSLVTIGIISFEIYLNCF